MTEMEKLNALIDLVEGFDKEEIKGARIGLFNNRWPKYWPEELKPASWPILAVLNVPSNLVNNDVKIIDFLKALKSLING